MINPAPEKIKLHRKSGLLEVTFQGACFQLPAEYLRVYSPSAEVQGHGPGQEVLQVNKQDVAITAIEPQGNYAIKLIFSDGHDSGIYSWSYLRELGDNLEDYWNTYLDKVNAHKEELAAAETSVVKWITPPKQN